jgi:hypothetical protein
MSASPPPPMLQEQHFLCDRQVWTLASIDFIDGHGSKTPQPKHGSSIYRVEFPES